MKHAIPTTRQKIMIYSVALKLLQSDISDKRTRVGGFCYYIVSACSTVFTNIDERPVFNLQKHQGIDYRLISKECFPELFKYEPKELVSSRNIEGYPRLFWFNTNRGQGALKRVKILQTEIALLKAEV